jgi:adenylate kinase family enzyme
MNRSRDATICGVRIAVTGPSGSGKTWLSERLARSLGVRHVELDALHHGPNWTSCGPDVLRERVLAATEDDGWVVDGLYQAMLGDLVLERAETFVWLDLPVPVVTWRLVRRTLQRKWRNVELWNGNREGTLRESFGYVIWPALKRALSNRRDVPEQIARNPHLRVYRLRSDRDVRVFLGSVETKRRRSSG